MPKVASSAKKKKRPAKRVVTRRNAGRLETIGAQLDSTVTTFGKGVLQLTFMTVITLGLLALVVSAASGRLSKLPDRIAWMSEAAARSVGLNVYHVTIKGGESLTKREVMQALRDERFGSVIGRPLMTLDADAMRETLENLDPVKAAVVQKLLPDTLHVSILERDERALYLNEDGTYFVVDSQGVIVRESSPTEYTDLPVISGTDDPAKAAAFLRILREHPAILTRVKGIVVVSDRRFDLRFGNGFVAKLPEEDVRIALARLEKLETGAGRLSATLDYIDLRDPKWAYYKPKDE
ncbi:MAG: cell division protein FtsQ/DivIB [Pseudomonadota bacterium]